MSERPSGDARRPNAVALAYAGGDSAPTVVAKGSGLVAEQIIARARDAGVFVHESKELVALLMNVDLDREIPPALYRAIAELLAWLYHIEAAQDVTTKETTADPDAIDH
jgi:flagellar biosynthesis protein